MKQDAQSSAGVSPQTTCAAELVAASRTIFTTRPSERQESDVLASEDARSACPDEKAAESFCTHVHKYITEIIRLADQKATFAFALCTSLLCYAFNEDLHHLWLKSPRTLTLLEVLCFSAMLCLAIGLLLSAKVIVPNLRKSHRGFVYFVSIAEYESSAEFASEILAAPSVDLRRALLQHTYDIAKVSAKKYWWLVRSLWFTAIGVLLMVVVLLCV